MQYENPNELLANLVEALNSTNWSSWQSTANFQDQWYSAEKYLENFKENAN